MTQTPKLNTTSTVIPASFLALPPEIRNAVYDLVFGSLSPFFIVVAEGNRRAFRLRDRSDKPQNEVVRALQALGLSRRDIRHEARTLFYATRQFILLPYGYEYLPTFVRWLEAIGSDCRAVMRTVCFAGYMWYRQDHFLTLQLHDLLRMCASLQTLVLQIDIWHLCATCTRELCTYLNFEGPEPHDGPIPMIDLTAWGNTLVHLPKLESFRLDIIMSVDKTREAFRKEIRYMPFATERGRALAKDMEIRLRERMIEMSEGSNAVLAVRYVGTNERVYDGSPW
jgi:hypothetical protein